MPDLNPHHWCRCGHHVDDHRHARIMGIAQLICRYCRCGNFRTR